MDGKLGMKSMHKFKGLGPGAGDGTGLGLTGPGQGGQGIWGHEKPNSERAEDGGKRMLPSPTTPSYMLRMSCSLRTIEAVLCGRHCVNIWGHRDT